MTMRVLTGDCLDVLRTLDAGSVQMCVTSPPYFGLRDYGVAGQIGLESTPDAYVSKLVAVFREVRRVLRDDGTLWLNLGDSYTGGGNYRGINSENTLTAKRNSNRGARGLCQQLGALGKETGLEPKNLLGIPWRVAFALQADGWYLRSDIIWHKPNPMPESVTDRPTKAHEYLFLLAKSERYYYDADAISEESAPDSQRKRPGPNSLRGQGHFRDGDSGPANRDGRDMTDVGRGESRNRRTVWTVATTPYSGAHFATFPPALIEPCIKAGSRVGDTVLDPFGGAGTTGLVADRLSRHALLIELNPTYAEMARRRIIDDCPIFAAVEEAVSHG